MATSKIQVTEGSGKNLAAYQITEDATLKEIQRIVINDSTGTEITQPLTDAQIRATALPVSVSGGATAANQATGNASLSSIDTKLTSQATASNQDTQTTALNSILAELQNDTAFSETVWYDVNNTSNFYIRVATVNQSTGVKTITFQNIDGTTANVTGLTLVQVISNSDFEFNSVLYKAIIAGTGYSIDDRIQKLQIINMNTATLVNTIWNNETTGSILSTAPTFSNLVLDDSYATLAEQQSQTTKLTSIDTKLSSQATAAKQDTGNASLSSIDTKTPALGQAVAASSVPVVLTAIQEAALTPPAAITGFALETTQVAEGVLIGAVTETAPANDTASSGLNGRLQRLAQQLTSLLAVMPTTLGVQATMANSLGVAFATDQAPIGDKIINGSIPIGSTSNLMVLNGQCSFTLQIDSSTSTGSFTIQTSIDGGTTWENVPVVKKSTNQQIIGNIAVGAIDTYMGSCFGMQRIRVNGTLLATAAAAYFLRASDKPCPYVFSNVALSDGNKVTYSASASNITSVATATDVFTITGSATKTIRISKIEFEATQTTAGYFNLLLVKRTTANTAGTSIARTQVAHDSNSAAATATVLSYTANPTIGTLAGAIKSEKIFVPAPATASMGTKVVWEFGDGFEQALVLRGVAQVYAINFNGVTLTGGLFSASITWTEE